LGEKLQGYGVLALSGPSGKKTNPEAGLSLASEMTDSKEECSRIATHEEAEDMEVILMDARIRAWAESAQRRDASMIKDQPSLAHRARYWRRTAASGTWRLAGGKRPAVTSPEIPVDEQKGNKEAKPRWKPPTERTRAVEITRGVWRRVKVEGVAAGDGNSRRRVEKSTKRMGSTRGKEVEKTVPEGKGVTGVNGESVTSGKFIAGGVDQLPGELDAFDSKEYEVYKSDQSSQPDDFFIEDTEVELVWELVWALRDLVRFRERSYRLLLDVSRKATQLAKDMKMPAYWRNRVIPGSVAVAMQVDSYERNAVLSMSTVAMRQDAEILTSLSKARPIGPGSSFGEALKVGQGAAWLKDLYRSWRYSLKGGLSPI
jgi:hypothetical protein